MKLSPVVVAVCAVVFIGISGCDSTKKEAVAPAPTPAVSPQAQPGGDMGQALSGKVVETMDAAGYTYVSLEQNGKRTWVALPQSKVKVGQQVTCQPGMVMENFKSKTLNRTFDRIIFSGGIM